MRSGLVCRDRLDVRIPDLSRRFASAAPFPHVVVHDFLTPTALRRVQASLPKPGWGGWSDTCHEYQPGKLSCADSEIFPPTLRRLAWELQSRWFIGFLERLSGIDGLLTDPYLHGGGLHLSLPGGWVGPHADFRHGHRNGLIRRLSMVLYLTPDGAETQGGELALWDHRHCHSLITPRANSAVVFLVRPDTVHSVMPVLGSNARQSFAMFYYSAPETEPRVAGPPAGWRFDLAERSEIPRWRSRLGMGMLALSLTFHRLYVATNRMAKGIVAAPKLRTGTDRSPPGR